MTADEMRSQLAQKVAESLHAAFAIILKNKYAGLEAIHFGLNTALSSIIATVPLVAKRPKLGSKEIDERGADELVKLINYETILFAALVTARMNGGIKVEKSERVSEINAESVCINQTVDFGPLTMSAALEDWKKLTGKNPRDYLDNGMMDCIEFSMKTASAPFDEFLQKRLNAQGPTPTSGTLQ